MITIKISELIEAAEKNGYEWGRGGTRNRTRLCVLEQAAKNLGFPSKRWAKIARQLNDLDWSEMWGSRIYGYNDIYATSYEDAVNFMKKKLKKYRNKEISLW